MAKGKVGKTVESLGDYLREQRIAARLSLRQLAEALRISAEQLYIRAGIISPEDGVGGSVELAVLNDTGLTERQKQSLLDVYASFLALNAARPVGDISPPESTPDR